VPEMGQMLGVGGLSVAAVPEARLVVQEKSCQSGLLSLSTPKFEPPTTSR
jgi:hypothetical protein